MQVSFVKNHLNYNYNTDLYAMISDEMVHMMRMTNPKLIFCHGDNIATVREAMMQLNISVPIFTFEGNVDGARHVDELFIDTGTNINHFVYS